MDDKKFDSEQGKNERQVDLGAIAGILLAACVIGILVTAACILLRPAVSQLFE